MSNHEVIEISAYKVLGGMFTLALLFRIYQIIRRTPKVNGVGGGGFGGGGDGELPG
jgi:hypothetical protein